MPGLGTIINVVLLVAGGLLGLAGGRFITPRIQDTLMKASGLCVLFIGLGGTMQKMLVIDGKALATTGTTVVRSVTGAAALVTAPPPALAPGPARGRARLRRTPGHGARSL